MSKGLDFLSAICINGNASELRRFGEEYYVDEDELTAWRYCLRHVQRFGVLPTLETLEEETGVAFAYCEDSVEYYSQEVLDRKFYNDARTNYNELRVALSHQDVDASRTAIQSLAAVSRQTDQTRDLVSIREAGAMALERYDVNHRIDGLIGIPTGWHSLDQDSSGYQPGDLNLWAARPGEGKTWLLVKQARAAYSAGANLVMATMEMPINAMAARYFSLAAGVNPTQLRRGTLSTYDEQRLRETIREYDRDERFFMYQGNMGQGVEGLEAIIAERRPDIVFIDGVYLMRSGRTRNNAQKNDIVSDVLDDLKQTALHRNTSIVCTSQFNREAGAKGRRGGLETLGFTDAFSQHCSLIYAIKNPTGRMVDRQTKIIETIKGREGESVRCAINYKFNPLRFDEIPLHLIDTEDAQSDEPLNLDWMRD